jgi:hypothetical protein
MLKIIFNSENMAEKIENSLDSVTINNELYFKINNVGSMRSFFMSIVSDSNHWLFVSSNGGISAGRKNSNFALFPYYTDDKISESTEVTGSKTILKIITKEGILYWEPFSVRSEGRYSITRNLYQNKYGNKILFEEVNHDLKLVFKYQWSSSNLYGFVKQSTLVNLSENPIQVEFLDGLQNIMPQGVPSDLQTTTSNLVDGYKRSELVENARLAIFALSAIIVDKAEPAEALKANIVWSAGLKETTHLLSALQLTNFRNNQAIVQEEDIKGEKGAYFIISNTLLQAKAEQSWYFVANVNQNHSAIIELSTKIKAQENLILEVLNDVEDGTLHLQELTSAADSFQFTADTLKDTRHYNNVLFNLMRGGIFDNNYTIEKWDFILYLKKANTEVFENVKSKIDSLGDQFTLFQLNHSAKEINNVHFTRLATEYLPLKFSRRHGDPSRPWNQFSINTRSEIDGSKILDYQGNWRDIFQNWEALAYSYPAFIEGMISKFLNASTFDGYNPYRVTKDGFDWETIEPDNPWSYIGYWGDHQIIYLLKFLEFAERQKNGSFAQNLNVSNFVYANVPYKIKDYANIVKNSKDTIEFDHHNEQSILARVEEIGSDGALLVQNNGDIYTVSFAEKILATVLSKLSNFIPEAGIWMNTQRPEWNDANNALVGNGVSMVTLNYLRRFLVFLNRAISSATTNEIVISSELQLFFNELFSIFSAHQSLLSSSINNKKRKEIADALGTASSDFRQKIYDNGFSGKKQNISLEQLTNFLSIAIQFLEQSIKTNKRNDGLYHAYNLLSFTDSELQISNLSEMLEGQVAVLSAGFLSAKQSLEVLDALRASCLYRPDQNSYILYPNKQLPKFLQKNILPKDAVEKSDLLQELIRRDNTAIIEQDINGAFHFNGNFMNARDLSNALDKLDNDFSSLVSKEKNKILEIFEEVFNHKEFTGRSGTFFAFEGLGSIYWHMVSKLAVAAQETCLKAIETNEDIEIVDNLIKHYYAISEGIGVHKSPKVYGAFPITPYSHTPFHKGAQQPGMTGQVKEDILTRIGELGVKTHKGKLLFQPQILLKSEFLTESQLANFILVNGTKISIDLPAESLAFTFCQVPIIYKLSTSNKIEVEYFDGKKETFDSYSLSEEVSTKVFERTGEIKLVEVFINSSSLQ